MNSTTEKPDNEKAEYTAPNGETWTGHPDAIAAMRGMIEGPVAQNRQAAARAALPALERLCEVMRGRSDQPYKVRALLYSLYNGHPADLTETLCLDWQIKTDLCAVILGFGYESPRRDFAFFYDELKAAVVAAGQWKWFIEANEKAGEA